MSRALIQLEHALVAAKRSILRSLVLFSAQTNILVGGQAVIEGVMMRVPGAYAVAVRDPEGRIRTDQADFTSIVEEQSWLKLPFLRGIIHLFESLRIGFRTLQWSADISFPEDRETRSKFSESLSILLAFSLAVGLFFVAPIWLTTYLLQIEKTAFGFNLVAGSFRVAFFLLYLTIIARMADVRRLFQYHGAEHKTVYTFEAGSELTVENTRRFSTRHPRCGTSFIFIVMIVAILTFALIDTLVIAWAGDISLPLRLAIHLPLIPLVAGVGYEALKITAKYRHLRPIGWLAAPGLWLQYITTSAPDDDQVRVALVALETAFGDHLNEVLGKQFVAEAIA